MLPNPEFKLNRRAEWIADLALESGFDGVGAVLGRFRAPCNGWTHRSGLADGLVDDERCARKPEEDREHRVPPTVPRCPVRQ